MNETTARFPRTTGEAFKDGDYACALERPARARRARIIDALCWIAAVLLFTVAFSAPWWLR